MTHPHTPDLRDGSVEEKRREILQYFNDAFSTYESLFSTLKNDQAFYQKPEKLRHPLIFYYGHTATFFINKLILAKAIDKRINPKFEALFAVGVDEMSWDDLNEANYDWPAVEQVREYRQKVRALVTDLIQTISFSMPVTWDSPMWPIIMGIEHERIHLETSSVLIRQLDINFVKQHDDWKAYPEADRAPDNALLEVTEGTISRCKLDHDNLYGWDNEYGTESVDVSDFKASKHLVSNAEFLQFVNDDGYQNKTYWQQEGWQWREYTKASHPVFWRKTTNGYVLRNLLDEIPLPDNWPVEVNYHEAKAFCHWKGLQDAKTIRLPTEHEWLRIRDYVGLDERRYSAQGNINLSDAASSVPVDRHHHGDFYDVIGNVWQWTETPIYPLPGFKVHPLYDDFTTPTFDNKHNLIKGGSWVSTGNLACRDSRYAFRRHFFQHAGFRYVESTQHIQVADMDYESDTQVSQYCEFHYGAEYFSVPNFAKTCAQICLSYCQDKPKAKALDLGCAVGRSAFELATVFDHVDAIDFSARFIKTATTLQETGEIRYTLVDEGDLTSFHVQRLSEMGITPATNLQFMQGDACNLKPQFSGYDLIFMGNLLDRVYSPRKVLKSISQRLNVGGVLVITSPFTWLEEYTEKSEWLGGYKDETGETLTSTEALQVALGSDFKRLAGPMDIPFVIRETKRKFQHSLSECSVFEKVR